MTGFQLLPSLSELTHALDCEKIVLHSYHGVVRLVGPAAFPESVDYAGWGRNLWLRPARCWLLWSKKSKEETWRGPICRREGSDQCKASYISSTDGAVIPWSWSMLHVLQAWKDFCKVEMYLLAKMVQGRTWQLGNTLLRWTWVDFLEMFGLDTIEKNFGLIKLNNGNVYQAYQLHFSINDSVCEAETWNTNELWTFYCIDFRHTCAWLFSTVIKCLL